MTGRRISETVYKYPLQLVSVIISFISLLFGAVILSPAYNPPAVSILGQAFSNESIAPAKVIGLVFIITSLMILIPVITNKLKLGRLGLFLSFLIYDWLGLLYLLVDDTIHSFAIYPFSVALISMILYLVSRQEDRINGKQ